jgi:hypothetical protein
VRQLLTCPCLFCIASFCIISNSKLSQYSETTEMHFLCSIVS